MEQAGHRHFSGLVSLGALVRSTLSVCDIDHQLQSE